MHFALRFEKSLQERSTVMEVRRVNIAIVIIANASTAMVPPDTGIAIEKPSRWSRLVKKMKIHFVVP